MTFKTYAIYALLVFFAQNGIFALGRQHGDRDLELKLYKIDVDAEKYMAPTSNTNARVQSRISVFDMVGMTAYGIASEISKSCIYGRYCGSACHAQAGSSRPGGLDGACYDHDRCLSDPRMTSAGYYCRAPGLSGMKCTCEKRLAAAAWQVYNNGKQCSWYALWCGETAEVTAAWAVGTAMNQRIRCGGC